MRSPTQIAVAHSTHSWIGLWHFSLYSTYRTYRVASLLLELVREGSRVCAKIEKKKSFKRRVSVAHKDEKQSQIHQAIKTVMMTRYARHGSLETASVCGRRDGDPAMESWGRRGPAMGKRHAKTHSCRKIFYLVQLADCVCRVCHGSRF